MKIGYGYCCSCLSMGVSCFFPKSRAQEENFSSATVELVIGDVSGEDKNDIALDKIPTLPRPTNYSSDDIFSFQSNNHQDVAIPRADALSDFVTNSPRPIDSSPGQFILPINQSINDKDNPITISSIPPVTVEFKIINEINGIQPFKEDNLFQLTKKDSSDAIGKIDERLKPVEPKETNTASEFENNEESILDQKPSNAEFEITRKLRLQDNLSQLTQSDSSDRESTIGSTMPRVLECRIVNFGECRVI